eukprot:5956235-Pyramimonas_sp.AAC.1
MSLDTFFEKSIEHSSGIVEERELVPTVIGPEKRPISFPPNPVEPEPRSLHGASLVFSHASASLGTANHMRRRSDSVKCAMPGLVVACQTALAQAKAGATMPRQTGSPCSAVAAVTEYPARAGY